MESEKHGLFEIRHIRLPHKGDCYNLAVDGNKIDIERLKIRYFTKFQALNFYYNEVNKYFYNICPAFYRFKLCPLEPMGAPGSTLLNRVYEVEEYMGQPFMQDLAIMHDQHLTMIKNENKGKSVMGGKSLMQISSEAEQKSLPHYLWGSKIAKMVKNLEGVKGSQIQGAGRVVFDRNQLQGELRDPKDYYRWDRAKYYKYLEDFKKGWGYFLSVLECDLIESKLKRLLDS